MGILDIDLCALRDQQLIEGEHKKNGGVGREKE